MREETHWERSFIRYPLATLKSVVERNPSLAQLDVPAALQRRVASARSDADLLGGPAILLLGLLKRAMIMGHEVAGAGLRLGLHVGSRVVPFEESWSDHAVFEMLSPLICTAPGSWRPDQW